MSQSNLRANFDPMQLNGADHVTPDAVRDLGRRLALLILSVGLEPAVQPRPRRAPRSLAAGQQHPFLQSARLAAGITPEIG
jgi:hypothetical protein